MKKNILYALLIILTFFCELNAQTTKYRVLFTDKNNSPYSISNPSAFLTARAIQRRANQGISIQQNDLPPNPAYIQQVIDSGATVLHQSRWFNSVTVIVPNTTVLARIQSLPFVQNVKPVNKINSPLGDDYRLLKKPAASNGLQTNLGLMSDVYNYGLSQSQVQQLGGDCMHNQGYDGKNMVICILDAGFLNADTLACFDSLWANNQVLGTWDFVANNSSVFEDHLHGAMVLSCMGANWPGNIVGTAPKAHFWLVRTEDAATELVVEEDNWVAGAEFADSVGADIINSSLGYTTFDAASAYADHTYSDLDGNTALSTMGADLAASKGIFVCNSAGNDGSNSWGYIGVPADGDSVCAVGAVDVNGIRAGFSSHGPTADGRTKPDVAARGEVTAVIDPTNGTVTNQNGTSFSSPLTAGMVACLWQANPTKNNMEILTAMRSAGNQVSNPDNLLGWGIPNYCMAHNILSGIAAQPSKTDDQLLNVFYDHTSESVNVYFYSKSHEDVQIMLHDISGKLQISETRSVNGNAINFFKLQNTYTIATGIYLLTIKTSDKKFVSKILKY